MYEDMLKPLQKAMDYKMEHKATHMKAQFW